MKEIFEFDDSKETDIEKFYEEHSELLDKYLSFLVDASWDGMWLYHMQKNYKEFTGNNLIIPDSDMNILIKFFGIPVFKNTHEYNNLFEVGELFNSFTVDLRHGTYPVTHIKWLLEMHDANRLFGDQIREYEELMKEYNKYYFCRIVVNAIRNQLNKLEGDIFNESPRDRQSCNELDEI